MGMIELSLEKGFLASGSPELLRSCDWIFLVPHAFFLCACCCEGK